MRERADQHRQEANQQPQVYQFGVDRESAVTLQILRDVVADRLLQRRHVVAAIAAHGFAVHSVPEGAVSAGGGRVGGRWGLRLLWRASSSHEASKRNE